uniref:Uncharacterized protein n=1 Tax=Dicentrarchus labrax TaxID=13489 RepID=A0A8P4KHP2_DICLA
MMLSSVLLVLLQVCSLQLMVVSKPACQLRGDLVQSLHHVLRDLGGDFPAHCLPYNNNISFPNSALPAASANHPQCRRALWVVYESLSEAELIFLNNDSPVGEGGVTWDDQKLEDFQTRLNRLVEDGRCLSRVGDSVSPYFTNVTAVIEQQESTACGWSALKRDLLWVLKSTLHDHRTCFTWLKAH